MIGYIQLYFKIIGESNTYYYLLDCEFGSPLDQEKLDNLKQITKDGYSQIENIKEVSFITKEEYEENTKDYETTTISWNEEGKLNGIIFNEI